MHFGYSLQSLTKPRNPVPTDTFESYFLPPLSLPCDLSALLKCMLAAFFLNHPPPPSLPRFVILSSYCRSKRPSKLNQTPTKAPKIAKNSIYKWTRQEIYLCDKQHKLVRVIVVAVMLETIRYLVGLAGPSGFGSKSTAEQVTVEACLHHQNLTAIITGGTSGIGAETARVLAMRGMRVVLPARSMKVAEETKAKILEKCPAAEVVVMSLDLSSLCSVRNFVADFESLDLPLNLLINNAGRFFFDHAVSEEGIEMSFVTNYLGHFLLTKLLLKRMKETAARTGVQGRIVNVTSNIYSWFSGDMYQYLKLICKERRRYDATRAYALSKLAIVLFTRELANRLQKEAADVTVNCVHPGIVRTRLTRDREGIATDLAFFLASKLVKTIPQAAATTCFVATHPNLINASGKYFEDCNEAPISKNGSTLLEAERLWTTSVFMVESIDSKRKLFS